MFFTKFEFDTVIHKKKRIKTTKTKYNVEEYLKYMNFSYDYFFVFKKECFLQSLYLLSFPILIS